MTSVSVTGPIVSVEWLNANLNAITAVDVRPQQAYLQGHITGAVWSALAMIAMPTSSEQDANTWAETVLASLESAGVNRADAIVFYEDYSGTHAARAAWAAESLGFGNVAMLDGGLTAWTAAGHPLTADATRPARSRLEWTGIGRQSLGADELHSLINKGPNFIQIIDTRADREWDAGTIPGSVHYEWTRAVNGDGRLRPLDDIRAELIDEGVALETGAPIATFCGSGYRAAHVYILLKAMGVSDPRNYAPSWTEWSARPELPIEAPVRRR